MNSYDADFRTALHLAAAENRLDIVKYLIDKGAVMNKINKEGIKENITFSMPKELRNL